MALKKGITKDEIIRRAQNGTSLLEGGSLSEHFADMMMDMTPEEKENAGKASVDKEITTRAVEENAIVEIDMDQIQASPMNTFDAYPTEEMELLQNSIEQQGLLEPIIVRPKTCCESYAIEKDFEIIAGHNRYAACKALGGETIKCAIVNVDDVTASLMIAQSNIQRPISEIEVARNYRKTYDLMKEGYGGDRKTAAYSEEKSSFRDGNLISENDRTLGILAKKYGIGQTTMFRKIRLTDLADEVLDKYMKGKMTQEQAVQISFADKDMQIELLDYYSSTNKSWINDEKAAAFGQTARKLNGRITPNQIREIMQSDSVPDKFRDRNKDRRYIVPTNLFPAKIKLKDRPMYIAKALEYVQTHNIEIDYKNEKLAEEEYEA